MTMNDQLSLLDKKYKPLCVIYIKLANDLFYKKDLSGLKKLIKMFEETMKVNDLMDIYLSGGGVLFDTGDFLHDTMTALNNNESIDFEWLYYMGSFTKEDLEGN